MSKDTYWFKHDSSAGRGLRMRKMAFIYGHWGKGIYWDVIEVLRDQENYSYENDEISLQMLCDIIGCKDVDKFQNWLSDCVKYELFKIHGNKFFSEVLRENMEKWDSAKNAGIQSGKSRNKKKNERNANESANETRTNDEHKSRVEENIVEKSREESINITLVKKEVSKEKKLENNNTFLAYRNIKHLSISHEDFNKLKDIYGARAVDDILDKIENYSEIDKYTSLYLTAKTWLDKNKEKEAKNNPEKGISFFQGDRGMIY